MPTIVISAALRDALTRWNVEQVGRRIAWQCSTLRADGRYDVEVDDQIATRLEAMRGPSEQAEGVLWRAIGNPGASKNH
jgi:hypothetical protein